jgi:cephalosporin-C deacetylase-like acetyl esterase
MSALVPRAFLHFIAIALLTLTAAAQDAVVVSVATDREDALYKVGTPVTYTITVKNNDVPVTEGEVNIELSQDGITQERITRPLSAATVTSTLNTPGFLWCIVSYAGADGKATVSYGSAGFDPLDIKPSLPVPDDFDAFWADKKAKLAEVPMNAKLTSVESPAANVECFDVQVDCLGGAPVSGYLTRPIGAQPKSLAAMLFVHGAGVVSARKQPTIAAEGVLALDINAHGIPNGQPDQFYKDLSAGKLNGYPHFGKDDRETSYFLGMYLRLIRAMEFLEAQPEWDGKIFMVEGTSQGGGQSLAAAGLNPKVTLLCAGVPAICEHTGIIAGWPLLVPRDAAGTPDAKVLEASRYFDAMNFATRTKADALLSVGFVDGVCRPTSVYAAYNNLPGKKEILNKPHMNHAVAPEWDAMVLEKVKAQIANRGK